MSKNLPQSQSGRQVTPVDKMKGILSTESVQQQFKNALAENANLFVASLIDLYASDTYLQQCNPGQVVAEALKAATLKLPISKSLGFAYVVPYKKQGQQIPQFQIGYKGLIQLAMRSGIYRYINAGVVYEGEFRGEDKLTGALDMSGSKTSNTVVGYFAYLETVNGFKKTMFMKKEDMERYAEKYSKSYSKQFSPWQTEFDAMAEKTMLRRLLSKYGQMSIDMAEGMAADSSPEMEIERDYSENANQELIDITPDEPIPDNVNQETGEVTPDAATAEGANTAEANKGADPSSQQCLF